MNRRGFIKGAMAAVAASYAGGSYAEPILSGKVDRYEGVSYRELQWHEDWVDYDRQYRLSLQYIVPGDTFYKNALRVRWNRHAGPIPAHLKEKMQAQLLQWLEQVVA